MPASMFSAMMDGRALLQGRSYGYTILLSNTSMGDQGVTCPRVKLQQENYAAQLLWKIFHTLYFFTGVLDSTWKR